MYVVDGDVVCLVYDGIIELIVGYLWDMFEGFVFGGLEVDGGGLVIVEVFDYVVGGVFGLFRRVDGSWIYGYVEGIIIDDLMYMRREELVGVDDGVGVFDDELGVVEVEEVGIVGVLVKVEGGCFCVYKECGEC